jgi:hypothetical protein
MRDSSYGRSAPVLCRRATARLKRRRVSSCSIFSNSTMDRMIKVRMNVSSDLLNGGPSLDGRRGWNS